MWVTDEPVVDQLARQFCKSDWTYYARLERERLEKENRTLRDLVTYSVLRFPDLLTSRDSGRET